MTGRGGGGGRRVLLPPINFIFRLLQQHTTVQIWLYEQLAIRIEGKIRLMRFILQGFDEFMNLVIDDAVEVKQVTKANLEESRRSLGWSLRHVEPMAIPFAKKIQDKYCLKVTMSP
ncbi:Small nuclear ribonucleoprotein E [Colletotrichum trifolii]|uniref:Small nuclear ribonucleoprotein E n=1 Tax=Colletotrichum trifolii TaxID=5466 RepID=A0A4R8PXR1_COLTR|nr:Small nuclear ribonucleoprotein E [Colletotrichum trifolii]TDZ28169.1 Small nuclear ribonucleoprotein E [Colletotrichum trifolii]